MQYYLIKNDIVGQAFVHALLRAADRGVRVRILLDDIFTSGYNDGMAALDYHPFIEIRVFNPFNRGIAGRAIDSVVDFRRINRRMHNKSFTVDDQVSIIGGRNIADEYFGARADVNFGDLDVIAIGPVVQDISNMFDLYWNHPTAVPVPAFYDKLKDPDAELDVVRTNLADAYENAPNTQYGQAVRSVYSNFLNNDAIAFRWSPYQLVYDSPDKGLKDHPDDTTLIKTELIESLASADEELVIISPYFVPRKFGIEALADVRERDIAVTIITNSLASNNQLAVHAGYAPSRKPLLEQGVRIYEARPDGHFGGADIVAASGAKATLHTKAFVVDRREVFIGSFNFDPRSANINTEMGVIIRNPEYAIAVLDQIHEKLPGETYEVYLSEDGHLRWRETDGKTEVIYKKEPRTGWWTRFKAGSLRAFPIRSQL